MEPGAVATKQRWPSPGFWRNREKLKSRIKVDLLPLQTVEHPMNDMNILEDERTNGTQQNGAPHPNRNQSLDLLKDHLELASLEWGVEKKEGRRRLLILGAGTILITSSYVYFQIALIGWFLKMGFSWASLGLMLGFLFLAVGLSVIRFFGKRQEGLGQPFQGSRNELKRSIRWIEKLLF
jgi:uncharacterized membrane protein YqjE